MWWYSRQTEQEHNHHCCAVVQSCLTLRPQGMQHARLPCPPPPELAQTHVYQVGNAFQWSHPLLSPSSSASNLSQHQGFFQWVSFSDQVAKVLESQLQPNEYSGLISFRMDWFDFLAVKGTLKSLLQHHSSKSSILRCSAFFTVQISHPYMTTGKTIALTRWTFVGNVMSLFFNMLSMLVINFLPRSKCLSIHGWNQHLQWFWRTQNKVSHCFHCFHIYLPWSDGTGYPAYLTSMQSTSWETLGWKKHKLESGFLGEISITSDMQMTPSLWQKLKNWRASWWKERGEWKSWLKAQHSENEDHGI